MNSVAISVRYAKAVFLLAKEKNLLDKVRKDFILIRIVLKPEKEFNEIIYNPVIKGTKKKELFTNIFQNYVDKISLDFLKFIVDKGRETYLFDIIRNFEKFYREERNIKEVIVTTPVEINMESEGKLTAIVKNLFQAETEITKVIDDSMIGGIKIRIDNLLLDMSVRTQLEEIKKTLKSEKYKVGL
ncbi:MAG: ATP synthase F1 subunit delta [Bacteroidales bacterium]|jgi:F-type H+-transporting ATPase subunit delta|nr:ATP synthase F1 subunit delta [Bacteroidales bacterium]